jgi:hypothetical protein
MGMPIVGYHDKRLGRMHAGLRSKSWAAWFTKRATGAEEVLVKLRWAISSTSQYDLYTHNLKHACQINASGKQENL